MLIENNSKQKLINFDINLTDNKTKVLEFLTDKFYRDKVFLKVSLKIIIRSVFKLFLLKSYPI